MWSAKRQLVFLGLCLLLVSLEWAPVDAACSIYEPGLPLLNGVPRCACGELYLTTGCVGTIPTQCSECFGYTTSGCKPTGNTRYGPNPPAGVRMNPRCQCKSGACCITTGAASGMFQPSSYQCRASGVCNLASKCTGSSASCPAIQYRPTSTVCRASTGPCQNDAHCTGYSTTCPSNTFKSTSTVCSAASGPCQNSATCTGSTAACPAKTIKPATTRCHTARGPCESSLYCDGANVACPAYEYANATQICNPSEESCFFDAKCTGTSPYCQINIPKPIGASCGNNTLCSTFTNNTCNAQSECIAAECTSCPDGFQGADCTCPGNPPMLSDPGAVSLNATCFNGTWTVKGDINGSLTIAPGTTVNILGNLIVPEGSILKIGVGSTLNVSGCANLTGTLTGIYSPKFGTPANVHFNPNCSNVQFTQTLIEAEIIEADKCTKADTAPGNAPGMLTLIFTVSNTCGKNSFNYLNYVVAPVLSVAGATGIALGTILAVQHYNKPEPIPKMEP